MRTGSRPCTATRRRRRSSARARVEPPLADLVPFIDWQFFFHAWDLKGKFPAILANPAARELYDDAQALLREILQGASLRAVGVYGFWPAHAEGDDVVIDGTRFSFLRQQADHGDGRPNRCLADYVAPADDFMGAFAVGIHGADELSARYEAAHDDYSAIAVKALADRLAEAFAEFLHQRVRREWYAPDEHLSDEDLLKENFRGIRPAFGYPACPDHSEKGKLFDLLGAEQRGPRAHGELRDAARRRGQRRLLPPSAVAVLRGRPDRARPARGLRRPPRDRGLRGRALARPKPRASPSGDSAILTGQAPSRAPHTFSCGRH